MNISSRKMLGLIAVGLGFVTVALFSIGDIWVSSYQCDNASWRESHDLKASDFTDSQFTPVEWCHIKQNQVSGTFMVGIVMMWFCYAVTVAMWRSGISESQYDDTPLRTILCSIHMHEMISHYMWMHQFKVEYGKDIGNCKICNNPGVGTFIKSDIVCEPSQGNVHGDDKKE